MKMGGSIFKSIKTFTVTLLIMLSLSLTLSDTVFASETQGTGDNSSNQGEDTESGSGTDARYAWSDYRLGYRIYVVDDNNVRVGDKVIDTWYGEGTLDEVLSVAGSKNMYKKSTRSLLAPTITYTAQTADNVGPGGLPKPWNGFSSGSADLENWVYSESDDGTTYGKQLVIDLFGEDLWNGYVAQEDKEYYLAFEPITMFSVFSEGNKYQGYEFAGTNWGYASFCLSKSWNYGGAELRRGTNGTFAVSVMQEYNWLDRYDNMKSVPRTTVGDGNWLTTSEMFNYAYGIALFTFESLDNSRIHTWDYALGSTPGRSPMPDSSNENKVTIVKVYCTKDRKTNDVVSWDGSFIRKLNPVNIDIEDEPEYSVEQWKTTKNIVVSPPSTWDPVEPLYGIQKGTSSGTVSMDPNKPTYERTLYVLLVKYEDVEDEADLVLHESEISRYYQMSSTREFSSIDKKITWTAPSLGLGSVCGHGPLHDNHDGIVNGQVVHRGCNHYCGETDVSFTDNNLNLKVKNQYESSFRHILATVGAFAPKVIPESGVQYTRSYKGQVVISKNWDYRFVIWRGEDELTLSDYNFTDSDVSWQTSPINTLVTRVSNTPESTRWTARETDVPLTILLKQDDSGDYTTRGQFSCGHGSSVESIATPDREINANAPVKVYTYSGQPSGSVSKSSPKTISSMSGTTKGNGRGIEGDTVISFYPYIRMTYEQMGSTTKHDVNVLSQHKRSLTVNEYFEAGYKKASDINLNITSQQWSVHQLATNPSAGNSWSGRNKVLPGGALYSVDSDGLSGASIVLRTWQFVSEGENRQRLVEAGTSFGSDPHTVASATQAHQEFVNSSIESFNNGYFIEQSVNSDPNASNVFSGNYSTVQRGGFGLNGALSDEDKYYMNNDSGSVGDVQSALVQAGSASTSTVFYRVYSDTSGNLYLATGSSYGGVTGATGTRILRKDQSASNLTGTAKELDSRTGVVSNFISAIERNTGDDETASWAPDAKWYNEAFELTIMVQTSQFGVGLQNPARRETVLDPALCPSNSGQSDLFSSAYSSAYRLGGYSINFPDKGSGYAGTFKGEDINISGIQDMYKSKVFVIPNVNVQDLD